MISYGIIISGTQEGKIYGMPVKFSIPIIYGDEQAKAAFTSLESLKTYVEEL